VGATSTVYKDRLEVRSTSVDPQVWFSLGPDLGRYGTIIVRARFSAVDRISLFFGRQIDGRGMEDVVPKANEWLDIYINVSNNAFWVDDHGDTLRFDPGSERSLAGKAEIAGVWGADAWWPDALSEFVFLPIRQVTPAGSNNRRVRASDAPNPAPK
jgi:hypothetical protein